MERNVVEQRHCYFRPMVLDRILTLQFMAKIVGRSETVTTRHLLASCRISSGNSSLKREQFFSLLFNITHVENNSKAEPQCSSSKYTKSIFLYDIPHLHSRPARAYSIACRDSCWVKGRLLDRVEWRINIDRDRWATTLSPTQPPTSTCYSATASAFCVIYPALEGRPRGVVGSARRVESGLTCCGRIKTRRTKGNSPQQPSQVLA